jgi:uncharacterized membrane protein (UPF0127 family)
MRGLLVLALALATGCGGSDEPQALDAATLRVEGVGGPVELAVEVANTDEERATGLMGREELDPYDGMVFTWPEPTDSTFTMRNTLIPLSIAFWDERGRIVAVLDMEPCEAEPCPSYEAGRSHVGAIEVEQGRFDELGIGLGDRVELTEATT